MRYLMGSMLVATLTALAWGSVAHGQAPAPPPKAVGGPFVAADCGSACGSGCCPSCVPTHGVLKVPHITFTGYRKEVCFPRCPPFSFGHCCGSGCDCPPCECGKPRLIHKLVKYVDIEERPTCKCEVQCHAPAYIPGCIPGPGHAAGAKAHSTERVAMPAGPASRNALSGIE